MARIRSKRVVLLLTPEEEAALENAVSAEMKKRGLRSVTTSGFVRDMLLDWVEAQQKAALADLPLFGSNEVSM